MSTLYYSIESIESTESTKTTDDVVYICLQKALVREQIDLDSPKICNIEQGETISVLEVAVLEFNGQSITRLRCSMGWVSLYSSFGAQLFQRYDASKHPDENPTIVTPEMNDMKSVNNETV